MTNRVRIITTSPLLPITSHCLCLCVRWQYSVPTCNDIDGRTPIRLDPLQSRATLHLRTREDKRTSLGVSDVATKSKARTRARLYDAVLRRSRGYERGRCRRTTWAVSTVGRRSLHSRTYIHIYTGGVITRT